MFSFRHLIPVSSVFRNWNFLFFENLLKLKTKTHSRKSITNQWEFCTAVCHSWATLTGISFMLLVDGAPPPYSKTVSELLFLKLMALSVPLLLKLPVLPRGKCACVFPMSVSDPCKSRYSL